MPAFRWTRPIPRSRLQSDRRPALSSSSSTDPEAWPSSIVGFSRKTPSDGSPAIWARESRTESRCSMAPPSRRFPPRCKDGRPRRRETSFASSTRSDPTGVRVSPHRWLRPILGPSMLARWASSRSWSSYPTGDRRGPPWIPIWRRPTLGFRMTGRCRFSRWPSNRQITQTRRCSTTSPTITEETS